MYVSKKLLITRLIGWDNLLQSQTQLVPITSNVNVELYIGTFILDINDKLHVKMHLRFIVLKLKVSYF